MQDDDSSGDLVIDRTGPEHREGVTALWDISGLVRWWNDPEQDFDRLLAAENAEILVGFLDREPVASVAIGHDGRRGWLHYLAVHPGCRERGYGRQMVRAAELWLSERRLHKVNAMIRAETREAAGFYKALGYETDAVSVVSRWLDRAPIHPDSRVQPDEEGMLEATITHLEMTARPSDPPPHPPVGRQVALMRAERPTLSFYRYLYNTVGGPWLWWERRALDDQALSRIIHDSRIEIYVLYVDGSPAGFGELDRRWEPEIDISYFGLAPDFIGQALGPYLLGALIHTAWSYGPDKVTVHTNTLDHPKALSLYQRMGFEPARRETWRFIDPRATGLISPEEA